MILNVYVDEHCHAIDVADEIITQAHDYFAIIDQDLDKGYQMSRQWVESLTVEQRCQVVADKMLTALETDKQRSLSLLAAYIFYKVPTIKALHLNLEGDMTLYHLETH